MKKNKIRLTESDLHRIVKECVNRIITEGKVVNNKPYFDYGGAIKPDPKTTFVADFRNRDKPKEEIEKHNSRVRNRGNNVDQLEARKNAIDKCVKELMKWYPDKGENFEKELRAKLYWTVGTIDEKLAYNRAVRAAIMDKSDEGGEGFQYLSNPWMLPAGLQ